MEPLTDGAGPTSYFCVTGPPLPTCDSLTACRPASLSQRLPFQRVLDLCHRGGWRTGPDIQPPLHGPQNQVTGLYGKCALRARADCFSPPLNPPKVLVGVIACSMMYYDIPVLLSGPGQ